MGFHCIDTVYHLRGGQWGGGGRLKERGALERIYGNL